MTETIDQRPLVTFALFAYNQEKYIREAIEGAFSQTYEPLEIILSDDSSSDKTFEIMQEMAVGYEGPHRVVLRRNQFNLGTALHVQTAFFESQGDLFVVAAGDDISLPQRVDKIYSSWNEVNRPAGLLHSGYEIFEDNAPSNSIRFLPKAGKHKNAILGYVKSEWLPAAAPTCAYTREVFECFQPLQGGSIVEDMPLFFRSALIGSIVPINEFLVKLRKHAGNNGSGYKQTDPARWNRFIQSKIIAFRTMQGDLRQKFSATDRRLALVIERNICASYFNSSKLFISELRPLTFLERILIVARILKSKTISKSIKMRAVIALDFLEIDYSVIRKGYRIFIRRNKEV